jgi:transposase-like protein
MSNTHKEEVSQMKGRKWTGEEKLAIVLEGLKGPKPVAEICREHQYTAPLREWTLSRVSVEDVQHS